MGSYNIFAYLRKAYFQKILPLVVHIILVGLILLHFVNIKNTGSGVFVITGLPLYQLFAFLCYWESVFLLQKFSINNSVRGLEEIIFALFFIMILSSLFNPINMLIYSYLCIFVTLLSLSLPIWYKTLLGVFSLCILINIIALPIVFIVLLVSPQLHKNNLK